MSDLVKRLRSVTRFPSMSGGHMVNDELVDEAADRIEKLERELAEASGLIAQIKDEIRDTEDAYRSEVDFADHLKSELAAEKALADDMHDAWRGDEGYDGNPVAAAYRKARGL